MMEITRKETVILLLIYTLITTFSMWFFKYKFIIATSSNHIFGYSIVYIITVFLMLVFYVCIEEQPITKLMDILLIFSISFAFFWIPMLIDAFIFEPIFIK